MFFSCIAGMSILGGFSTTLAMAKKKDPGSFAKVRSQIYRSQRSHICGTAVHVEITIIGMFNQHDINF